MTILADIRPQDRQRIYDLVKEAGIDVSDWAHVKGGIRNAPANPKYCYEWSFIQPGKVVVLNLWHDNLHESSDVISREMNLRRQAADPSFEPNQRRRALKMDQHIQTAYLDRLPVRVVLLERGAGPSARAARRALDTVSWAVTDYDWTSGETALVRGAPPIYGLAQQDDEELAAFEGRLRRLFVLHRARESKLRKRKLEDARRANGGRLVCEVPRCGFDFRERYGDLGDGFAHVHHLVPLADAPPAGHHVSLSELAVVCANCHAVIHRGGECRPLEGLIPST